MHTVIFLLYGIMDTFMPATAIANFGGQFESNASTHLLLRMIGTTFLAFAVLTWFMRDASPSYGRRAGIFCLAAGLVMATAIQIIAIMEGTLNQMNWIGVAISGLFGAAYIYYANLEHKHVTEREAKQKVKA